MIIMTMRSRSRMSVVVMPVGSGRCVSMIVMTMTCGCVSVVIVAVRSRGGMSVVVMTVGGGR